MGSPLSPSASTAVTAAPTEAPSAAVIAPGSDLREAFRAAYENRYTWDPGFGGYQGRCVYEQGEQHVEGLFRVGADLKAVVEGIDDVEIHKALAGQLWEVAIHRVRRPFEQTHGENTFTAGDTSEEGVEVIVGGKGEGDRYRIKDDVVTMVHRHIHGTVVTIHTQSVTHTGSGYLSRTYSSQYSDPASGAPRGGVSHFTDTFVPLVEGGPWVLSERVVETRDADQQQRTVFRFEDLQPLD